MRHDGEKRGKKGNERLRGNNDAPRMKGFKKGGREGVNHLPYKSCKLPKFLYNSRREKRVIR